MDVNSSAWKLFNIKMQPDFGWLSKGNSERDIYSGKLLPLHLHTHHNVMNFV